MPKKRWNKKRVIAELRKYRENGPKMHTQLDAAARRHFGSVRKALKAAGLPCGKREPPYHDWSRELVIQAIRERMRDLQSLESTNREDPSLYASAKRLFGTWSAARAAAGFPRPSKEFYTALEVQLLIVELYEQELPLTFRSHNDLTLRRSAKKHFGGWRKAVQSLGLEGELRRNWCPQKVIDAILHRRASGLKLYATHREDKGLFCAAVKLFGNWQNALQAAGIKTKVRERWSEARVIERLREVANTQPSGGIRRIDNNLSFAAARRFGSLEEAMKAAGLPSKRMKSGKRG